MIVVDTNVIAYLLIAGNKTATARAVFERDSDWVAPSLWESEFLSVLSKHLRARTMNLADAIELLKEAADVMDQAAADALPADVLKLVEASKCSSYDCEFVALAKHLGAPLVTVDAKVRREFPGVAVSPEDFEKGT
ncbi:MAG: type II toxin-antitoxin system VapC family toxin [Candidatus Riflebacteria bacterium]|nr:type II toxin-antitoxin system VapC family toxin [Candidatus Riflebacteria bacterium]